MWAFVFTKHLGVLRQIKFESMEQRNSLVVLTSNRTPTFNANIHNALAAVGLWWFMCWFMLISWVALICGDLCVALWLICSELLMICVDLWLFMCWFTELCEISNFLHAIFDLVVKYYWILFRFCISKGLKSIILHPYLSHMIVMS